MRYVTFSSKFLSESCKTLFQVNEAEKYYFQLTTDLLRHARVRVMNSGYIWSVEVSPNRWEQYSNKNIELIENALVKRYPHV